MELVGLAFYIIALVGYVVVDDFLGHILAGTFFSSGTVFLMTKMELLKNSKINDELIIIVFLVLNIFIITGLFIYKSKLTIDKVDEIK